jgi:hypothetical protein
MRRTLFQSLPVLAAIATAASAQRVSVDGQAIVQERAVAGASLYVSPAVVRQVKQALNQQGYRPSWRTERPFTNIRTGSLMWSRSPPRKRAGRPAG